MSSDRAEQLYEWLAQLPTPVCEQILAAGLEQAEPSYPERIVEQLFERGSDAGWAGLIANYQCLTPTQQQRLLSDPQQMRAGLALALQSASAKSRCAALAVLSAHPCPALSYLLPDALRDTSDEARKAAARTLRRTAEFVLDVAPGDDWDETRREEYESRRGEVARAAGEAIRTFELHYRLEALEVGLWFAKDLGETLWELLGSRHSQCGHLVGEQLRSWNSPRLARFLLEGLARPAWRLMAQQMLLRWRGRAETVAILQNTEVLANAEIRRQLSGLREVRWFEPADGGLDTLPGSLQASAPRWVCHLGLKELAKYALLSRWLKSPDPAVQRTALYALATLDGAEARGRLAEVAGWNSPLATFARWHLAGRQLKQDRNWRRAREATVAGSLVPAVRPASSDSTGEAGPPARTERADEGEPVEPTEQTGDSDAGRVRRELRGLLAKLSDEQRDPEVTNKLARQVEELLRQLPAEARDIHISRPSGREAE